ncbi:MAG: DUF4349 domain-containing protein [Azoarcus sp.]|jgi:hypothetical protein|nr:DUF4349 domain-containing protein [Azoarcus sp.]
MNFAKNISLLLLAATLAACAPDPAERQAAGGGDSLPVGQFGNSGTPMESMLAYEHRLNIVLSAELIPARLAAAHAACANATFGTCNVLNEIQYEAGNAVLQVRIDPAGVAPLAALAQEGGKLSSRESKAEDLAEAVMDNRQQQEQLANYAARLNELARSPNIKVSDLITIAQEQAKTQQQLKSLSREAAQQRQRIATNLLTIQFDQIYESVSESPWARMGRAFSDFFGQLAESVSYVLSALAYGLPMLLAGFPILLLWRKAWRKFTGRDAKPRDKPAQSA